LRPRRRGSPAPWMTSTTCAIWRKWARSVRKSKRIEAPTKVWVHLQTEAGEERC